jgi:hypothetical protein
MGVAAPVGRGRSDRLMAALRSTALRVAAAAVAFGGLVACVATARFVFLIPAIAALLLLATSFSEASRSIEPLQDYLQHDAEVRVWGAPLPVPGGTTTTITSVRALGAGLHVFLRVGPGGKSVDLKIAQPSRARLLPRRFTIESARYVQWAGRRLPRVAGAPALTISLDATLERG